MVLGITGHRPSKLGWGYDLDNPYWIKLRKYFMQYYKDHTVTEVITGMGLGVDTVAALAALDLKNQLYDIKLHCAIPCQNQECKWPILSQKLYHDILSKADMQVLVTDAQYSPWSMQRRNEYVVDLSDSMLALWNGSCGGTANCIKYAEKQHKPIEIVQPSSVLEGNYGS